MGQPALSRQAQAACHNTPLVCGHPHGPLLRKVCVRPWVPQAMRTSALLLQVPTGHVWLQGDNTLNSTDSRHYGPVPYALLEGRVFLRVSLDTCMVVSCPVSALS